MTLNDPKHIRSKSPSPHKKNREKRPSFALLNDRYDEILEMMKSNPPLKLESIIALMEEEERKIDTLPVEFVDGKLESEI